MLLEFEMENKIQALISSFFLLFFFFFNILKYFFSSSSYSTAWVSWGYIPIEKLTSWFSFKTMHQWSVRGFSSPSLGGKQDFPQEKLSHKPHKPVTSQETGSV